MEAILFLTAPFIMCVALVGIHCHLGLHVLARGVIFVDLALAQVAALGSAFAFIVGFEHHDITSYFISLGATFMTAIFLAYSNRFRLQISQEAIIGVIYALASAATILLIDKVSHGSEHLKQSLIGNLLWVTMEDVVKVVVVYSGVGVIHYLFRRNFMQSSLKGTQHWVWDFLFYGLFGIVITSSVHYAGLLLVFSFLIVPSVISAIFYQSWTARLFFGWGIGIILSLLGMVLSYYYDLPSGAVIVVVFTICPILLTFLLPALRKN